MAFIQPKRNPCRNCTDFTPLPGNQCVQCGWLKPLPGDPVGFREVPLGPPQVCCLLTILPEEV